MQCSVDNEPLSYLNKTLMWLVLRYQQDNQQALCNLAYLKFHRNWVLMRFGFCRSICRECYTSFFDVVVGEMRCEVFESTERNERLNEEI